jgi:hypothetical protein
VQGAARAEFYALHEGVLCPAFVEVLIDFRKRVDIAEGCVQTPAFRFCAFFVYIT